MQKLEWTLPAIGGEEGQDARRGPLETIISQSVSNEWCYTCAAISTDQLVAVATSKDNILLYDLKSMQQDEEEEEEERGGIVGQFVGHTS